MFFDPANFISENDLINELCTVTRLAGGYWNDVFRVRNNEIDWVVKHFREVLGNSLFPNLPDHEALALKRLSGLDVAPDLVSYFPKSNKHGAILIYRYVEGEAWRADITAVADLLRRQHTADPHGFRSVPTDLNGILDQGAGLFARCDRDPTVEAFLAIKPQPRSVPPLGTLALLHTDIGATNLIEGSRGLRLIDWQCPAQGDPAEDVWSFLSPAFQILNLHRPLSAAEREQFLAAYGNGGTEERLAILEPSYSWRMAAYCCLRYQALRGHDEAAHRRYVDAANAELDWLQELM